MIIENRALRLAKSFALYRYNHRAVIITLKARSFQNGSQFFFMFRSRKLINTFILSNNHQCNYTKTIPTALLTGISEDPGFYWHHFTCKIFLSQHRTIDDL